MMLWQLWKYKCLQISIYVESKLGYMCVHVFIHLKLYQYTTKMQIWTDFASLSLQDIKTQANLHRMCFFFYHLYMAKVYKY